MKTDKTNEASLPLVDYRLAAGAITQGFELDRVTQDPASGRLTFYFQNLPGDFVETCFSGSVTVNLRDFLNSWETVQTIIAQYRARRNR